MEKIQAAQITCTIYNSVVDRALIVLEEIGVKAYHTQPSRATVLRRREGLWGIGAGLVLEEEPATRLTFYVSVESAEDALQALISSCVLQVPGRGSAVYDEVEIAAESGWEVPQITPFSGANRTPDYATTWASTASATFDITGVQLEVGSVATDFEHRTEAEEALRCKRYYISSTDFHHICVNNGESDRWIRFMVEMRDAPTVTTSPTNSVSFAAQNQTKHGFAGNGSGAALANFNMPWTADAEL